MLDVLGLLMRGALRTAVFTVAAIVLVVTSPVLLSMQSHPQEALLWVICLVVVAMFVEEIRSAVE